MYGTYCRLRVRTFASDAAVVRAARGKLMPTCWHDPNKREMRHSFYREMLGYHHRGQETCREFRI